MARTPPPGTPPGTAGSASARRPRKGAFVHTHPPRLRHARRGTASTRAAAASAALALALLPTAPAAAATPSATQLAAVTTEALTIGPGSQGPAVVVLQDTLNDLGAQTAVDGIYGSATAAAETALARSAGLTLEPLSMQLALLGYGPRAVLLNAGDKGPAVTALQHALTRAGFGVEATGIFGPQTEAEVKGFQAANGMEADGQVSLWRVEEVAALEGEAAGAVARIVSEQSSVPAPAPVPSVRQDVARLAASLDGRSYVWGGLGPWGFDCSGLVVYVMREAAGLNLPHNSFVQWDMGAAVAPGTLQPGDLVFFSTDGVGPSHVGIYIGGAAQDFVDATNPAGGVQIDSLYNAYWGSHYIGARDVLG